jgi:hypothetical protein
MTFEGTGVSQIRGINLTRVLKGFADEVFMFKKLVTTIKTANREIRWMKRESGVLDTTDSQGMTASRIDQGAELALPEVAEQKVERQTSRVKIFSLMSPWISNEDVQDSQVSMLALNVKQVPRAVTKSVNDHIYDVLTESQSPSDILTTASTAGWDASSSVDIAKDINTGIRKIREQNYEPTHLLLTPKDFDSMMTHFISTDGEKVVNFSSEKLVSGAIGNILGLNVVVSNSVVADSATICAPKQAVTYYQFYGLSATIEKSEAINAQRVICREAGIAVLTDPKAVHLTTNTED